MEKCEKCLYYKSKEKCGECGRLSNAMDNNPMFAPNTNYDRIKSMSVEEMTNILTYCIEDLVGDISSLECVHCEEEHCTKCIKQWLLQEVSEDE